MKNYFFGGTEIHFDLRDIRPKGALLVTAGGKAPGPEPLRLCIQKIKSILNEVPDGEKLKPIQVHDIICHIADAVLAGGIRRSALISLFDADDSEMISCKSGNWWELNPQRGRANNSAFLLRHKLNYDYFISLWKRIELSGAGEPGIYLSNDKDWGTNPCCEIALRPYQFCNLCELNVSDIESQEDLNNRAAAAAFIGTLQASYTDFHYLRSIWKTNTERDALIGVGMTGIASNVVEKYNLTEAAMIVKDVNERTAMTIAINPAARTTTIKPSGTTSLVLGTSSGIHAWHDEFYLRSMRVAKNEAIYTYFSIYHPELLEDEFFRPHDTAVIRIPQQAPKGSILRTESPLELLDRIKRFHDHWVRPGHRKGENTNNVSATISIKENEWDTVGKWMWLNRDSYNGLSVLPYDNGSYIQAPFETITEEEFNNRVKHLTSVDLTKVVEISDNTNLMDQAACAGNNCEIV